MEIELISEAKWKIWVQDNFDFDCPRQVDLAGQGLVKGLIELWARHLFETVQPDGQMGFSRFNLFWEQKKCSFDISGEKDVLIRLRQWVFGSNQPLKKDDVQSGDKKLLELLASIHCRLLLVNQTATVIVNAAKVSANRNDFETKLIRLAENSEV